jgi:mono/diheme cytochrome c family protein
MNVPAAFLLAALTLALGGCERTFRDMYDQPRYKPLGASGLWADGRASRPDVAGTVAHSEGALAGSSSGRLGAVAPAPAVAAADTIREARRAGDSAPAAAPGLHPPAMTPALLDRGRNRFDIFCAPCHSIAGDGDGVVARRGFPHPPSFHTDALRAASDEHFYAVITDGYGAMHSYATRVETADRLAIVAYIRALQLSQHAPLAALSEDERSRLEASSSSGRAAPAAPR